MAFINYAEPINLGVMFAGLGTLLVCAVFSYVFYRLYIKFIQYSDVIINRDSKYAILEESFLDKIGKDKGIDLNQELVKRDVLKAKKKSFRAKIEEKIYEDMFGKEK